MINFWKMFENKIEVIVVNIYRDLAMAFGAQAIPMSEKESITALLTAGRRSKNSKTKTLAVWATKELRKLKPAS